MINADVQMSINSALTQIMSQMIAGKVRRKEYKVSGEHFNVAVKSIQTQHQIIDIPEEITLAHMAHAYVIAIGPHYIGITHTVQMGLSSTDDLTDPIKQNEYDHLFDDFTVGTSSTNGDMNASLTHIKTYLENILNDVISTYKDMSSFKADGDRTTKIGSIWKQMGSKMPRITTDRTKMVKIKHNKKYSSAFVSLKHSQILIS